MSEAIPVIDVADYLADRPGALAATAQQVRDALTTVGFFVLTGHGVPAAANQFGIAPHTDSNFITFLAQTEVPGLQVRMPAGQLAGCALSPRLVCRQFRAVNSGDMLKRWTNGHFKSTPHRAVPPVGGDRYAIPFFLGPNFDQVIECLPSCAGPDNPPQWRPITYAEWQTYYWYDANYDPKVQRDVA